MSNTNLTIDMITNEVLRVAHEKLTFIGTINRQFDESFGNSGSKNGNALRIRLPDQYTVTTGRAIEVQDSEEVSTTLTMATQKHVAMRFNSAELLTDIDDFSRRKIQPAVSVLTSDVENDVIQGCTKLVAQAAGTAGTSITSLSVPGLARAKLNQQLAPKSDRSIQMDSVTMANLVTGLAGLFQDSPQIKEQYREGMVGRTAMADYYENERVLTQANSAGTASVALNSYTIVNGDTDLTVDTTTTAYTVGSIITIADLYDIHPETKAAYGHLKQFTVTLATATVLTIDPPIYITGAKRNVGTATGAAITASDYTTKTVTLLGVASTNYVQPIMYHRDAFTFVTGELPLMAGADRCVRKTVDGLSLRVWTDSDIRNDEQITRIDILYGYAAIRRAWACRMIGAANA